MDKRSLTEMKKIEMMMMMMMMMEQVKMIEDVMVTMIEVVMVMANMNVVILENVGSWVVQQSGKTRYELVFRAIWTPRGPYNDKNHEHLLCEDLF